MDNQAPLHYHNLIDKTLLFIKENSEISEEELPTIDYEELPKGLRLQLFRHLEKEGYTFHEKYEKVNGGNPTERLYISIKGLTFLEKGGFVNQYHSNIAIRKAEAIQNWPKKYWYVVAITTFFIGSFGDIVKEVLKQKILPNTTISKPPILNVTDSVNRR